MLVGGEIRRACLGRISTHAELSFDPGYRGARTAAEEENAIIPPRAVRGERQTEVPHENAMIVPDRVEDRQSRVVGRRSAS